VLVILAGFVFFATLFVTVEIIIGIGKMTNLKTIAVFSGKETPLISVIVPACNEEKSVAAGLSSLLCQDYDNFEIIVINDRSTDNTGQVLRSFQKRFSQLKIITIKELPEGWLGKSNAMSQGAALAQGKYLLFTDADIIMEKTTLSRAIAGMVENRLDHLSLIFKNTAKGGLLNAMMIDAGGGLFSLFKPWKVKDAKSRFFIGVGAFNMIKADVYEKLGGHKTIKMHPIDDIMLGKLVKQGGFQQDCYLGYDFVTVPWYETPNDMIQGLMKNLFALYNFRLFPAFISVVLIFAVSILPFWGGLFLQDGAGVFFAGAVFCRVASFFYGLRAMRYSVWYFPWSFVTPYVTVFMIVRAVAYTLVNKGIEWRGTHYPLALLRKNSPVLW
jgi:glycosyltransferase involved in cell wall biosynthesis